MTKYSIIIFLTSSLLFHEFSATGQDNYLNYHQEVIRCEQLIANGKLKESIHGFDSLFKQYEFIFLRDCKLATELCASEKDMESGFRFLRLGIQNGWTLKDITKNDNLDIFRESSSWQNHVAEYDSLRNRYLDRLNPKLKDQVHEMLKRDQKKALGAFIRVGQKSKIKYAENKFAPHSEEQMVQLNGLLDKYGYPGEKLIGNNWWTSVILSHHNSISVPYNSKDTLYAFIKPKLLVALKNGEISPDEIAIIEDWKIAVLNNHNLTSFGFLGTIPNDSVFSTVGKNRADIGMRSIELRNKLIDIEKETKMNLYLPKDWQRGKISVVE